MIQGDYNPSCLQSSVETDNELYNIRKEQENTVASLCADGVEAGSELI